MIQRGKGMADELLSPIRTVPITAVQLAASQAFSSGFSAPHLDLIARISSEAWFRAGQHLWRQGEVHETCYLILKGRLTLEIYLPMHGPIGVDTIEPGEFLGGTGLIDSQKWNFDARALTDVHAIAIDCAKLGQMIKADHELGYEVYRCLAQVLDDRLGKARRRLLELIVPAHV